MFYWGQSKMNSRILALRGFGWCVWLAAGVVLPFGPALAQETPAGPPPSITLTDALARARQYGGQVQSANLAVLQAREDSVQARAARLPSVSAFNQFIYTE